MKQIKTALFSKNKDGSYQQWEVWTDQNKITVLFGKLHGKIQEKVTVCEGKSLGRSNETTPEEQAELEAISKWENQLRLGYRESIEELETEIQLSPMLAKDATKVPHLIQYPCHVSAKLDGLRCLVTFDEKGEPVFNSRGNKTYPIKGKIVDEIIKLRKATGFNMFDGEVYLHGLSLQKIVSLSKKWRTHNEINAEIEKDYQVDLKKWRKAKDEGKSTYTNFKKQLVSTLLKPEPDLMRYSGYESADLEFHIFDIPSKGKVWDSNNGYEGSWDYNDHPCRYADLMNTDSWSSAIRLTKIKMVHGSFMEDEDQTKDSIGIYMQRGYEGVIIRNFKGLYEFGQRSSDLLKWKLFQDTEAKVVNVEPDKNDEGILICEDIDGIVVRMKMKGTHEERSYENQIKNIGKFVNFTYQARTDDNNYSFPVGIYFREVNVETWEVEE